MARLNIEDSLYKDIRFFDLCAKQGGIEAALGAMVRAWTLAQKWYLSPERMIPFSEWQAQRICMAIIEVGLAEKVDEKVRMKGADEQFAWLIQRSNNGKKGGPAAAKARVDIKGKSKRRETTGDDGRRRFTSSSSSSSSGSPSFSNSPSFNPSLPAQLDPIQPSPSARAGTPLKANAFIATYCEEWKARYGTNPVIRGKEAGISGRLAKDLGTEKASELVISYLQMNDVWFVQKRHDLVTFENSLNAVVQFHETGKTITRTAIFQNDKKEANRDVWQQLIDEQRKKEAGNGQ